MQDTLGKRYYWNELLVAIYLLCVVEKISGDMLAKKVSTIDAISLEGK